MPQKLKTIDEVEKEFDKRFVDVVRDIKGGTAYLEWKAYGEEELIEMVKSFLRTQIEELLDGLAGEERSTVGKLNPNMDKQETAWTNGGYNLYREELLARIEALKGGDEKR
jgi:hypothetical protein